MAKYKILRFFQHRSKETEEVPGKGGLTLEEAQVHCLDPESHSWTCTTEEGKALTTEHGDWFDGYAFEEAA